MEREVGFALHDDHLQVVFGVHLMRVGVQNTHTERTLGNVFKHLAVEFVGPHRLLYEQTPTDVAVMPVVDSHVGNLFESRRDATRGGKGVECDDRRRETG